MTKPFQQVEIVHFVDVGCGGPMDDKWAPLFPRLVYTGFDPNADECRRLSIEPHPYKSCSYLPYAIAGEVGTRTMHKTESIYCYSLLQPNHDWLRRFTFSHLFDPAGTESVTSTTLNELAGHHDLRADVLKLDTQGLELPILRAADRLLDNAFCVETETGFVDNYINESVYAQVDQFMRAAGYLMFDMNSDHRIARRNPLARHGKHQPLWCEVVWLFDYVGRQKIPTREQALRALLICKTLEYYDYGFELASHFRDAGLIDNETVTFLEQPENWMR